MAIENTLASANKRVEDRTKNVFNHGNDKPGKLGGMMDSVSGIQKNIAGTAVGLGRVVAKAAGALGATGVAKMLTGSSRTKYKKTDETAFVSGLRGFYDKFSSAGMDQVSLVDTIDPLVTFECSFEFSPNITGKLIQDVKQVIRSDEVGDNHRQETQIGKDTINQSAKITDNDKNSIIGTLLTMVKMRDYDIQRDKIDEINNLKYDPQKNDQAAGVDAKDDYIFTSEYQREYAEINGVENFQSYQLKRTIHKSVDINNLVVNLGMYIQRLTIPSLQIQGNEDSTTLLGKFPVPGNLLVPDNNSLQMEVVNTQEPVLEKIFYPWMRETTVPKWVYDDQPFTTATIKLDFSEHANVIYAFYGCRPTQIMTIQADQSPSQGLTRNITFAFDYMLVLDGTLGSTTKKQWQKANLGSGPSNGNSGTGLANSALFSAANTFRL